MPLRTSELTALQALPCFNGILDITLLSEGLSHTCYKVVTINQTFFVKKLHTATANKEVFCSIISAKLKLSPIVIYHDDMWLVTDFIDSIAVANNYANSSAHYNNKKPLALSLMSQLHQIKPIEYISEKFNNLTILDIAATVEDLLACNNALTTQQRTIIGEATQIIDASIASQKSLSGTIDVLCHGDINYSNIITDIQGNSWLIDFECAQLAPIEFDIAMFIAVNNIAVDKLDEIINEYLKLVPKHNVNTSLVLWYALASLLINALWYLSQISDLIPSALQIKFTVLAKQQISTFDQLSIQNSINTPSLLSLLRTSLKH
ncbi:phosphotransferase [Colwellia echini]|uniref:Phosphotransferase n=1 Tax=Colwellia echini TaxID=1982103 RepID=A0ABY3MV11_9GAMM|nr:phosphotransferase [Colwellia echini]TYK65024.1 phosphotransferase [Colwellia echini]